MSKAVDNRAGISKLYGYAGFGALACAVFVAVKGSEPIWYAVSFAVAASAVVVAGLTMGRDGIRRLFSLWGQMLLQGAALGIPSALVAACVYFLGRLGVLWSFLAYFAALGLTWAFFSIVRMIPNKALQDTIENRWVVWATPRFAPRLKFTVALTTLILPCVVLWRYPWILRLVASAAVFAMLGIGLAGGYLGSWLLRPARLCRAAWWAGIVGTIGFLYRALPKVAEVIDHMEIHNILPRM